MLLNSHVKLYSAAYLFPSLIKFLLFSDLFQFLGSYYLHSLVSTVVDAVCHFNFSVFSVVFYGLKATTTSVSWEI